MQQVNAAFLEPRQSFLKATANQPREIGILLLDDSGQSGKDVLSIETAMLVALPGVNGMADRRNAQAAYGLAEGQEGESEVGPELYHTPGTQCLDQPERERCVLQPG